jgi:hypothetical protein
MVEEAERFINVDTQISDMALRDYRSIQDSEWWM